jgi:hypothetical protein
MYVILIVVMGGQKHCGKVAISFVCCKLKIAFWRSIYI